MTAPSDMSRRLRHLFEAAGELSSARDEDEVLHIAIRQARQLVGTDLAYIMLLDREHGDTYMRATEGAISRDFDTLRLGMGLGLGGQVAQTMSPRWTRDYLEDEQYTHVIDPIIIDEGLRAILGVPVKKHGRLTGVLFTSERTERDFTQDDITLLALLADHTSVAISAAERATETANELLDTRDALIREQERNSYLTFTADLHHALTDLVVAGAQVPTIVVLLVESLGGSAAVFDVALRELGSAQGTDGLPVDALRAFADTAAMKPTTDPAWLTTHPAGDGHVVVIPLVTGADHLGYLTHYTPKERTSPTAALERVSAVVALILLGHRALDEADNRVRGELLAEILIPGDHDPDAIGRRATLLGVDLDSPLVAVVASPPEGRVPRVLQIECSGLARGEGGLVTSYGDRVVMVLPGADSGATARTVAERLSSHGVTIGASGPVPSLADATDHVERARRAARLLVALGREGEGASTDELGLYGLLFSEVDRDHTAQFIERNVGPVREHDRTRSTALLDTLRVYFASEGSASATAETLFVHVNTVYQRLERLDSLLGAGWRAGDRALELRLALRLWELSAGPG